MNGQVAVHSGGGEAATAHRPLTWRVLPPSPDAAVLVLHGGREFGSAPPPALNLPGLRMRPFARAVERGALTAPGRSLAVGAVRYRCRGWNADRADAARDAEAALADLAEQLGPVPTVLIGHSMGGRAALRAAAHPCVRGVVALAPWCPRDEPTAHLSGRTVLMLHGDRDKVTAPGDTDLFALRAREHGARVAGYRVYGSGHTLLRRAGDWHRSTADLALALLGVGTLPDEVAAALALQGDAADGLHLPLAGRR
ncbi:serine aminopeptidase domain-containing protein [Streptomyces sp. TLI_171]|uniref:serine aminopeptidase domain-containing protein n=1 Tax=Streptomyces sp. TLI_171 TaxID=1938859 RepID=UPI000C176DB1|nr:alpha/beta fold hydrolase [Streptomyces sp. TLI_171]RKE17189.1 putative esterase [Streptomyces sp. TLI_171]